MLSMEFLKMIPICDTSLLSDLFSSDAKIKFDWKSIDDDFLSEHVRDTKNQSTENFRRAENHRLAESFQWFSNSTMYVSR